MTTPSGPDAADSGRGRPDPGLDAIMSERRQLINLAYRLLGSLAEAEDAVQETYARWYAMSRQQQDAIASPGAATAGIVAPALAAAAAVHLALRVRQLIAQAALQPAAEP